MLTRHLPALLATLTISGLCSAQRVVLPGATGGVQPTAEWTVLRKAELDAAERPSDPQAEPARSLLLTTIADLKQNGLTEQHILIHQPGSEAGMLRLVHAYSADGGATSDELLADSAVQGMRDVLEPELAKGDKKVTFVGKQADERFQPAGALLQFTSEGDGQQQRHEHVIVPAGERLQYFDCTSDARDEAAQAQFDALLQTFDGARNRGPKNSGLWIAGVAGALAGILTALVRRKRQARAIAAAAPATASGRDGAEG